MTSTKLRTSLGVLGAVVGLGAALAACASPATTSGGAGESSSSDSVEPSPSGSAPLSSTEPVGPGVWVSTTATGKTLVPDAPVVITVREDGTIGVNAGCNGMGGPLTDHGASWEVGVWESTAMLCEQALMDQEDWVSTLVTAGPAVVRAGDTITLTAGDISLTLVERLPAELIGTTWKLTELVNTDALGTMPPGVEETAVTISTENVAMTISEEGRLSLTGLCNTVNAVVDLSGGVPEGGSGVLSVSGGATTRMFCEGKMEAEQLVMSVLHGDLAFEIDDQTLRLTKDGFGLQFLAATGADPASGGTPTSSDEVAEPTVPGKVPTVQTVWVATKVEGETIEPGTEIVITLSGDQLAMTAGCNDHAATYLDEGDRWVVSGFVSTLMGCDSYQDGWVINLLTAGPAVTRERDEITLTVGDISLTLAQRMPAELIGTTWRLLSLVDDDVNFALPAEAEGATMTISENGQLTLTGICNGVGGMIDGTPADGSFVIEQGPHTEMFCDGVMDAEEHARAVLDGEVGYEIDDQMLILTKDGKGLQFLAVG